MLGREPTGDPHGVPLSPFVAPGHSLERRVVHRTERGG
jgi:hypothetical protein